MLHELYSVVKEHNQQLLVDDAATDTFGVSIYILFPLVIWFRRKDKTRLVMGTLYGEYNKSGVHIDINKNTDDFDVGATSLHEWCHQTLSSNSYVGLLDFLLMTVYSVCNDKKAKNTIKRLYERVSESSIKVQESVAMFTELACLKTINTNKYLELYGYYKKESNYYKAYNFKSIEFLLEGAENSKEARKITKNLEYIALLAMNIDIFSLNPLDGKFLVQMERDRHKYNANTRFFKVIEQIKKEKIELKSRSENDIQRIFTDLGLEYIEFSWDKFKEWATDKLLTRLNLSSTEEYIHYINDDSLPMYLLSVSAYNSNSEKYTKHRCTTIDEIEGAFKKSQVLVIMNDENNSYVRNILVNYKEKEYFEFNTNKVAINWFKYIPIVFTDRNHYPDLVNMEPKIKNAKIFVDLAEMSYLIEFINDVGVKEYYIYTLNEQFVVIFMKGDNNVIFFFWKIWYKIIFFLCI